MPQVRSSVRRGCLRRGLHTPPLRPPASIDPLTDRETALLAAGGASSKAIAERLVVSTRTVDTHLSRVYRTLGINGGHELASDVTNPASAERWVQGFLKVNIHGTKDEVNDLNLTPE